MLLCEAQLQVLKAVTKVVLQIAGVFDHDESKWHLMPLIVIKTSEHAIQKHSTGGQWSLSV